MVWGLKTQNPGGKEKSSFAWLRGMDVQTEWAQPQGAPITVAQVVHLSTGKGRKSAPGRPNSRFQPSFNTVLSSPSAPIIKHYFKKKSQKWNVNGMRDENALFPLL